MVSWRIKVPWLSAWGKKNFFKVVSELSIRNNDENFSVGRLLQLG